MAAAGGKGAGSAPARSTCGRLQLCYMVSNPEVLATYLAEVGTSILFISGGVFVNVAILQFANTEAGCELGADGSYRDCTKRIYGVRPSSIVALITTVAGVASACFMPYAGAVVDFTTRRRTFGAASAGLVVISMLGLLLLLPSTWLPVSAICISTGGLAYYAHSLARWAYVREIVGSEHELSGVVASMRIWQLTGQLLFLATVVALTTPMGLDDVQTARVAQGISTSVATPMVVYAWRHFKARPAKHALEPGASLWIAGVRELAHTLSALGSVAPGLRKLLLVSAFVSAPTSAFTSLAITFLTQQLAVPNSQVAIFAGVTLLSGIPGAFIYRALSRAVGNKRSAMLGIAWWIAVIALFSTLLRSPADQPRAIALAVPTGIAFGWIGPCMSAFQTSLMPAGREAELWGVGLFAFVSLTWLPPIVFAALNEVFGGDMRAAMASLNLFFLVALVGITTVNEPSQLASEPKPQPVPVGSVAETRGEAAHAIQPHSLV